MNCQLEINYVQAPGKICQVRPIKTNWDNSVQLDHDWGDRLLESETITCGESGVSALLSLPFIEVAEKCRTSPVNYLLAALEPKY